MTVVRTRTGTARGVTAVVLLLGLPACSGTDCDALPGLQAEREQRRQAYLELASSGASPERTTEADGELHAFERRVHDLEQQCADR